MHPALLVDEILQLVFGFLSNLPGPATESRWTCAQLARCCKAWSNPALDWLWMHLRGMEPVLTVLRNCEDAAPEDAASRVLHYTVRVRTIVHLRNPTVPDALRNCTAIFPRLESVVLFSQGCMVPYALASSPSLRQVTISTAFPPRMGSIDALIERSDAAALFLQCARMQAPDIQLLRIRGRVSAKLNEVIVSYTHLRSLSVHATSFRIMTFATVATFPCLETLDLSVFLRADEIQSRIQPSSANFPALRDFTIRAYGPVVEAILVRLPIGVLTKLYLELESCLEGPAYMADVFERLVEKTSDSLRELSVKDRTDRDNLQSCGITQWYDLNLLRPLARLKQLRRFTLQNPDLSDDNLRALAQWWPTLEHLDLGTYDPHAEVSEWKSRLTPAAHSIAASSFPRLSSIALPVALPLPNLSAHDQLE
ncbi:hypothetical protein L226DRAFT_510646 [Lentinus tigrinus ALCF2SS1-7]|uniref:F-box domain-containing protein n=1 Tax=Lentinus tigrinus ALCF2SS1-6 TaxID=1328759 RepID=A0A5C2S5L2_9APHY|nr:hypothetical protein L227DRAFT_504193 [Lentinus tigrinus ALCF2SS1-6]RPD73253.1 hypothetical protein L226DRAFT_510646 [Lentinus tigrinus ALCF2SS1-7]